MMGGWGAAPRAHPAAAPAGRQQWEAVLHLGQQAWRQLWLRRWCLWLLLAVLGLHSAGRNLFTTPAALLEVAGNSIAATVQIQRSEPAADAARECKSGLHERLSTRRAKPGVGWPIRLQCHSTGDAPGPSSRANRELPA